MQVFPVFPKEELVIIARVPRELLGGPGPGKVCRVALYLKGGKVHSLQALPPAGPLPGGIPGGWQAWELPPDWLLVPAFVDCHVHLAMDGVNGFRKFVPPAGPALEKRLEGLARYGVLAARDGGDRYNAGLQARGLAGVPVSPPGPGPRVTGRVGRGGPPGGGAAGVGALPRPPGGRGGTPWGEMTPVPRVVATGRAIFRQGHYGRFLGGQGILSMGELEARLEGLARDGVDQLKVVMSGVASFSRPGEAGPVQFSREEMKSIVERARHYGLPVMAHASSDPAVRIAVEAGVHTVEHGYFLQEETLGLMAGRGVAWVPTLAPVAAALEEVSLGRGTPPPGFKREVIQDTLERQLEMVGIGRHRGVTLALGTDAGSPGVPFGRGFWAEMRLFARAGYPPGEILEAAGITGARLLDSGKGPGFLARGQRPCWLCLAEDILENVYEAGLLRGMIISSDDGFIP